MTWTLLVRSHGRWNYLQRAIEAVDDVVGLGFFDRLVLSMDGTVPPTYRRQVPGWEILETGRRQGLTANLRQGWGALDGGWVFDLEEDFVVLDAPLSAMADVLTRDRDLAQMALLRQPWSTEGHSAGGVYHGPHFEADLLDEGTWLRQSRLFTLNPYVAAADLLRSLYPSVEQSLTDQLIARDFTFGFWGRMDDDPRVLHVGAEGGQGSELWLP